MDSCVRYFRTDRFPKQRARFSAPPSASWNYPYSGSPIQHRGAKGRPGGDGPRSQSGQGKAEGGTLDGSRGGSRSGPFRPLTGRAAVIQPRRGSGPARAGTRIRSELPGRTSGLGSRLRECCRRKKGALAALELSKGRDVEYAAGFALALRESSRSEALAGDLEKRFPEDTFVKFTYAPVLRALAALRRAKPADSVERLKSLAGMSWRRMASTSMVIILAVCTRPMCAARL